jgi:vitamin B12 transporter
LKTLKLLITTAALAVSTTAQAQTEIVVTALRTPTNIENTGTQVTIVDRDEIENRQTASVAEILATLPGITIDRSGNMGSYSSVRIRGAEGAQTLVLLDGVRMNDVAEPAAGFDFGSLITGNIDRIEVLRGPSSVLWGSQAVGGVVSLTTRAPSDTLTSRVRGEYGYADTVRSYADMSDTVGAVSYLIGGGYERSDGISAAANGAERDGFRAGAANAKVVVRLADNVNLDFRSNYLGTRFSFDGFPPPSYTLADTSEYSETNSLYTPVH